ncbi:hypothetical protein IAT40_007731 [Kwoniella sp. CBS 6097]
MQFSSLLSVLSLLALVSSAPHSPSSNLQRRHHRRQHDKHLHRKSHCDAKASSAPAATSTSAPGIAAFASAPSAVNSVNTEFKQKRIGAWDKGNWGGWGNHQSSTAVASPPPVAPPATQPVAPPPPSASPPASVPPAGISPSGSAPVAPPVDTAVPPPPPPVSSALPPAYSAPSVPPVSQPAYPPASSPLAPPATSASAGGGTPPPTGGGGAGGPVGVGIDGESGVQMANAPGLSWYWNWAVTPFAMGNVEFVACVWGEEMANNFDGTVPPGTTHIMSLNEPDMGPDVGGCNIPDVAKAASIHQAWTAKLTSDVKVGSIAVARGGDVKYFNPWVEACAGNCRYDFIPIHFYGDKVEDMIAYIKAFPRGDKPIWVTEFDCQDFGRNYVCNEAESKYFMETAIAWFRGEGSSIVKRWAWFGAFPKYAGQSFGLLDAGGAVNPTGQRYLSL